MCVLKSLAHFLNQVVWGFFCLFLFKVYFTRKYFYASNHIMINLAIRQLIIFTWYLSTLIAKKKWRKVTQAKILESTFFISKPATNQTSNLIDWIIKVHPESVHISPCQLFILPSRSAPCLTWLVCNNSATASCLP